MSFAGGGFYVDFKGSWTLQGIVSAGAKTNVHECDVGRYALYTKVELFFDWIRDTVQRVK